MDDPFPLYLPPEARRLFQGESLLRRLAQTAHWSKSSKLLEFHGSLAGLALSKALGCRLTVVEPEGKTADLLKERARAVGLSDRATFLTQPVAGSSFAVESLDGILALGRVLGFPATVAKRLRVWLAPKGRLALTVLLKVSRNPAPQVLSYWEQRLGTPLPSARDALIEVQQEGFEPEFLDSMGETDLDEYYRELEVAAARLPAEHPGGKALIEEMGVRRSAAGRSGVTWALMVLRRSEPGEKAPPSRDGG
jgi:hypothetical protein